MAAEKLKRSKNMDMKFKVYEAPSGKGWIVRGLRPVFENSNENIVMVPYEALPHVNPKTKSLDVLQAEDIICKAAEIRRDLYEFKLKVSDDFLDLLQLRRQTVVAKAVGARA